MKQIQYQFSAVLLQRNREIDKATAEKLHEIFLEIVIAPSFSQEALEVLQSKKNLRLLTINIEKRQVQAKLTSVQGGLRSRRRYVIIR